MKKTSTKEYILITLAFLFLAYSMAKVTGVIGTFNIPTDSMMPNYTPNSTIYTYNRGTVGRNDAIAYYDTSIAIPNIRFASRGAYIGRIVALEGERLEISQGHILINGQPSEANLRLFYFWEISKTDFNANRPRFEVLPIPTVDFLDSVLVAMEEPKARAIQQFVPMQLFDIRIFGKADVNIWGNAGKNWTLNNFGPITVPKDCVFILGDNRHNNEDSRYRGFVPKKDIIGKVLN